MISNLFSRARKTAAALLFLAGASLAQAQFTLTSSTPNWVVVPYPPTTTTDYSLDQQTGGAEGDIVGGGVLPSFYTKFVAGATPTTGNLFFRVRLGEDENPGGFKGALFVGIDGNGDSKIDIFVGVNNQGSAIGTAIWSAGTGLNISPSTTSLSSTPIFTTTNGTGTYGQNWSVVNATIDPSANTPAKLNTDGRTGGGGDHTDFFLSFSLPFADVVSAFQSVGINGVTSGTAFRYVMGTATQDNSLNQDLNGVNGGVNSTTTWEDLGAMTPPITPDGSPANVAPVNTVPAGPFSVARNGTIAVAGISVTDANANLSTVQLSVGSGSLSVTLSGGVTISAGSNASASLTLSGTQAAINTVLGTLTYTAPNASGPVTLNVLSTDSATTPLSDSDNVTITVLPNQPPVAGADTASTNEDTAVTFPVLGNDSDPDGGTLAVQSASVTVGGGSVVVNANNTLTYTPAANASGTITVNYVINDGQGGTASANVTITVNAVNDAPVAGDDARSTAEDTQIVISPLGNDTDIDGGALSITTASVAPGDGSLTFDGSTITYTPPANFVGTKTITYTVNDGNGGTDSADIVVTMTPVNDAPVAVDDTATTAEDTAKVILPLPNDTDVEGNPLTVTGASVNAIQGSVVFTNGDVTYTPALNFNGTATITYTISDGNGGADTGEIVVTVTPVNDNPVANNDSASTPEDTAVDIDAKANDTDVDGNTLSVSSATATTPANGSASVVGGLVRFTPAANFTGTTTIDYTVSDGNGGTASAVITVTVTPVNDAPVANPDLVTAPEDTLVNITPTANDTDLDGDALTITAATVSATEGALTFTAGGVAFTPITNFVGTATINYTISDGNGGTASSTISVTVTPVNDNPVANPDTATTAEDTLVNLTPLTNDTDVDGDTLSITNATVAAAEGTLTFTTTGVAFTPKANFNGTATISYSISDGSTGTASSTITVTVTPVNDAPVAVNDSATTPEDTTVDIDAKANDSDVDGDTLTVNAANLTEPVKGTVSLVSGLVRYVPAANFHGTATINYTVSDGNGGTASASITVTVNSVNDNPVAQNDAATTPEDTAVDIDALANDSDIDGDTLSLSTASVTEPVKGSASIVGGLVRFTPAANFNGTATINYSISDGNTGTASASITVTVNAVNDAPVAVNDSATTPEDTTVNIDAKANDTDIDNDTLSVTTANITEPAKGSVSVVSGQVRYVPAANFNGSATINYSISDGNGGTASAVITVTVNSVNDGPVAVNDSASTPEDTVVDIDAKANDTDLDNDTLTVTSANVPVVAQGSASVVGGQVRYNPAANFNGTATINYSISDGNGGTASASITVTVTPVNDAPVAVDDATSTNRATAKTFNVLSNDTDVDGDTLRVTSASVPVAQGTVTVNANNTLTFTPVGSFVGTATITYNITDDKSGNDSGDAVVSVVDGNQVPDAVNDTATTTEDVAVTFPVLGNDTDPDGDTLTIPTATVPVAQGVVVINLDKTLTFTPAANFNGAATVTYTVSDGFGGTDTATVTVTVSPVNDIPVANADTVTTPEDTLVNITPLANDTDADGDTLTITNATVPVSAGTLTFTGTGVAFTPAANFNGSATINYAIADGNGGTASSTITVTITPVNDNPVAIADTATTPEDTAVDVDAKANDSDVDGNTLTVTAATVTEPAKGSASIVGGLVRYTPAANFNGTATINYTVSDGNSGTASSTITVTVTPLNDAPVAVADTATTPEDTVIDIDAKANDTDIDGNTLTVTVATVTEPAKGSASIVGGQVRYAPAANFNGTATINYTVSDGNSGTASSTITVTVTPVNDNPVAVADTATTPEDTAVDVDAKANDTDVDGNTLTVTAATVTEPVKGSASIVGGLVRFTPAANFNGTATINYTVSDGNSGTASSTITVTVTPVNDAPVAIADTATTPEDTAIDIDAKANDTDVDVNTLTVTVATVTEPVKGSASIVGGLVRFAPAANFNGTATINYTVSDGNSGTASSTITVTVTPVNDNPVAVADTATTPEDTTIDIDAKANDTDVDGNPLSVTVATVTEPAKGAASIVGGMVRYAPAANFNGTATINYTVSDGNGGTASSTITVTVTPVNDAPVAIADTATTPEDTAVDIDAKANDTDVDGNTLTVTVATVTEPAKGTASIVGGLVRYTPATNFNGTATINYTVSDGNSGTASSTITVTVTPVNDAPVAVNDTDSTPEDTAKVVAVLSNDLDADGDALTITSASVAPAQGGVVINGGLTVTYTPTANFNGPAVISYSISDSKGGTASATATITVNAVNDVPVAVNDTTTTPEDTLVNITPLVNDSDADGDTLSVTAASVPVAQGTVTFNATSVTFTPAANFNGTATIAYSITDGNSGNASASITVIVTAVNDAPVAVTDTTSTNRATPKTFQVLTNDFDVDGDTIRVTSASVPPGQGSVVLNLDQTLTYTPPVPFTGIVPVTYAITDDKGGNATGTANVTVLDANRAPVAVADSASTSEDTAVTFPVLGNDTDEDGDTLTVQSATVPPSQGTVIVNGGTTITFTPAANFNGSATVSYTINDGQGGTDSAPVTVSVVAVNDAPVANNDSVTTTEEVATTVTVLTNDSDVDGDTLTVQSASLVTGQGTVAVNGGTTVTFTPATNFNGPATINYTINDGKGATASAVITINVTPVNDAPVAVNDAATTAEDTATSVTVLTNDTDVDGDTLAVTTASVAPAQGTVTLNGNTVNFAPAANFNGTATISYSITDGQGGSASASVIITVTPVNDAPVAVNDTDSTPEDTAKSIVVLTNDTDADGDTLTVTTATVAPAQGTVSVVGNTTLNFIPTANFNGAATINYSISDGNSGTSSAIVSVTVTPTNDGPVAQNDTATTPEDVEVTIPALENDSDLDGDALEIVNATVAPAQGSVMFFQDGTLLFTPAANFNGTATISYTIADATGAQASAQVVVTVTPVNDAPIAADDSARVPQGRPVIADVLANDGDLDGDALTVTNVELITGLGTVTILEDGTVQFTPVPSFIGTAVILYTVEDPNGGTSTASLTVTVDGLPIAVKDSASTPAGTAVTANVLVNDIDPEGLPLTVTEATVSPLLGSVTIQQDGSLQFTPASGITGQVAVQYTVLDQGGNAATATLTVSVGVTAPTTPLAVADTATTELVTPVTVTVLANDSDPANGTLTVTNATVSPASGTVVINVDGTITFTAATDFVGTATVLYTITNTEGGGASAPVTITVSAGNSSPIAKNDSANSGANQPKTVDVLFNDSDPDGDALTITEVLVDPAKGTVIVNEDGTITFTPAQGVLGDVTISYTVNDGNGGTATATLVVHVLENFENTPPVAQNDAVSTQVGVALDIAVLGNDTDADADILFLSDAVLIGGEGTVELNEDGTIHFTPAPGFNDVATIRYVVMDDSESSDIGFVTVNVNGNPVANTDRVNTPPGASVTIPVLNNDTDPDGNVLTVPAVSVDPAQGTVVINQDGTVTFTPVNGFHGEAEVFYTINDGKGGTAEGTILVMVNTPPALQPDTTSTQVDQPITVNVLPNDTDPDGDTITVIAATVDPTQGTVTVNEDGTLTFTPAPTFIGPAVITYVVQDPFGGTSSTTVTIGRANASPLSGNRQVCTYCGTTLLINALRLATDVDGDGMSIVSVTQGRFGVVKITEGGFVSYKPGRMFRGNVTDSFVVTLSDGNGGTTQTTITVRAFDAIAGTFQGLLNVDVSAQPTVQTRSAEYRGRITATMNGRAGFTAAMEIDGKVVRFKGTLTGALTATKQVKIAGKPATVTITYHDLTDCWSVTVQGSDINLGTQSQVLRAVKSGRTKSTVFDAGLSSFTLEESSGDAKLTLKPSGVASVVGKLPDGTPFSLGTRYNAANSFSLYRWIGKASATGVPVIGGTWEIDPAPGSDFTGFLEWRRSMANGGGLVPVNIHMKKK